MKDYRKVILYSAVSSVLISIVILIVYICKFSNNGITNNPSDFGDFGDFLGGILGVSFGIISSVVLYLTYLSQYEYSRRQDLHVLIQDFESNFYKLLEILREILVSCNSQETGYEFMKKVAAELRDMLQDFNYDDLLSETENRNLVRLMIDERYDILIKKYGSILTHYFRYCYHLLRYIDEFKVDSRYLDQNLLENLKRKYIDIVQAQMSSDELYLCFYDGISKYGRKKFYPLLIKYSVLENMNDFDSITEVHKRLFYPNIKFKNYNLENRNIIFIGGIHGVGKSYLCEELKSIYGFVHLSSSVVMKWDQMTGKEVDNVDDSQQKLIINLRKLIEWDKKYLLDGHYCLINRKHQLQRIPIATFKEINPYAIVILEEEPNVILNRRLKRDGVHLDLDFIANFQKEEEKYAQEVAIELGVKFVVYHNGRDKKYLKKILNEFTNRDL